MSTAKSDAFLTPEQTASLPLHSFPYLIYLSYLLYVVAMLWTLPSRVRLRGDRHLGRNKFFCCFIVVRRLSFSFSKYKFSFPCVKMSPGSAESDLENWNWNRRSILERSLNRRTSQKILLIWKKIDCNLKNNEFKVIDQIIQNLNWNSN